MPGESLLLTEKVFLNRSLYAQAEKAYAFKKHENVPESTTTVTQEVNKIRDTIKSKLNEVQSGENAGESIKVSELVSRLQKCELENSQLRDLVHKLETRLSQLDGGKVTSTAAAAPAPAAAAAAKKDDDFDLFDDDEEEDSEEKKRITEARLKAYADKKGNKPAVIAKSSILLDVKPWDDETDMKLLENEVRTIEMPGLVWGSSKLVPVAFGVKKLQIQCVIEDDKVSTEALEEQICAFEDYVQSVDIAAFNKI